MGNEIEETGKKMDELREKLRGTDRKHLAEMPLSEWPQLISGECGVYKLGEQYIAKPYDQIQYRLCSKDKAEEVLEENLDALLTFKYFPHSSDEETDRIYDIKKYCVKRIASSLQSVKFDNDSSPAKLMRELPSSCIAFSNGVYDFAEKRWLFVYDKMPIDTDKTKSLITYTTDYRIMWYINREFTPYSLFASDDGTMSLEPKEGGLSPLDLTFDEWMTTMGDLDKKEKSLFYELLWNMSYDTDAKPSTSRALHLAEVYAYLLYPAFAQYFVFFVGEGNNGKDSVFDTFFRSLIRPIPSTNSVTDIEEDKFVIGSLVGLSQNISSETETATLRKSAKLKQLTGSTFQTIEEKGVDKYTGYMNCKFVFSANNKDQLKFHDSSTGFQRRINMVECYWQWDSKKKFLKDFLGTFDTTYSKGSEIRSKLGLAEFFYTAMIGMREATKGFTKPFEFTVNDYKFEEFIDRDETLSYQLTHITARMLLDRVEVTDDLDTMILTESKVKLSKMQKLPDGSMCFMEYYPSMSYKSALSKALAYDYKKVQESKKEGEEAYPYGDWFEDNSFLLCINDLYSMCSPNMPRNKFIIEIKRSFNKAKVMPGYAGKSYIECSIDYDGHLKIRGIE